MASYHSRYTSSFHSLGAPVSKTHKTAVVIIPPLNIQSSIQPIRKKHDRQFQRWMPHINLIYPFKPKSEFSWIIEEMKLLCASLESFDVTLETFRYFRHRKKNFTLWLDPQPKRKLEKFQHRLMEIVPECNDLNHFQGGFMPHLSVGQMNGKEKTDALIKKLRINWKPLRFQLSEIALIWRKDPPDDRFRIWDTVKIGSGTF